MDLLSEVLNIIQYRFQQNTARVRIVVLKLDGHVFVLNHLFLAHEVQHHVDGAYYILTVLDWLHVRDHRIWR